jgi:glycosyltransferase involved in cell wall biosynthesis
MVADQPESSAPPLVSVIIPLYNAGNYLSACINSVLAQTWPNIEIIIVDDGSTDNSFSIAKTFESEKVKLLKQINQGASVARNTGLKQAKGAYVQFLDADDILSENKIEKQVTVLEKNYGCIAVCNTAHFEDGTNPFQCEPITEWYNDGHFEPVDFLIKLYGGPVIGQEFGGMIQPNAWLTPRGVIDKAGFWNEMRSPDDDGEFFCRAILASNGVCYAAGAVNYYRKFTAGESLSGQRNLEACKSILAITDLKAQHLLGSNSEGVVKTVLSRLYWENAYGFYPAFKSLSKEAENKAKSLAPHFKFQPYRTGVKHFISKVLGWKAVKYIQFLINEVN